MNIYATVTTLRVSHLVVDELCYNRTARNVVEVKREYQRFSSVLSSCRQNRIPGDMTSFAQDGTGLLYRVRAARATRLFFFIQDITSLINIFVADAKTP